LEDEAFPVQEFQGWCWEEKIPQRGGRICPRVITTDFSRAPQSEQGVEKSKMKTENLLELVNSGFLREKEMDMWRTTAGNPYPMEKNPDEMPMFARFVERGLALPASDFFKGLLKYYGIEYLNLNPNGIFHISVFVHFCESFLGIKPHWVLFRKFCLKPQHSANDPRVVSGVGIQMREDATD
jgi:hypothetical protein